MKKTQKITLALGHQKLESTIMNTIKENYYYTDVVTRKGLLYITVKEEMPDILIVNNELRGEDSETLYDILYKIRADFPDVRIILLFKIEDDEFNVLEPYIQIGIYDIWTKSNIRIDALVDFINHPLNFGDWASKIEKRNMQSANLNINPVLNNMDTGIGKDNVMTEEKEESVSGYLKIKKQENKKINDSRKIVVPTLVKNTGFVSGRPKTNKVKKEEVLKDNEPIVIPSIERKQADFTIDEKLNDTPIQNGATISQPKENSIKKVNENEATRLNIDSRKPRIEREVKQVEKRVPTMSVKTSTKLPVDKPPVSVKEKEDVKEEVIVPIKTHKPKPVLAGGLLKPKNTGNKTEPLTSRTVKVLSAEEKEALKKANNIKVTPLKEIDRKKPKEQIIPTRTLKTQNKSTTEVKVKDKIKPVENSIKAGQENKKENKIQAVKTEKKTEKINRECKTVLFAQSDVNSTSHTALNLAISLAKKGYQVAYISTFTASDDLFIKYTPIQIYDKFNVKQGELDEKISTLAILKYSISKSFDLIEKIKEENEVDYLIFNADIQDDFEKIMILSEESYILIKQNPVIFAKLSKSYKNLFKFMNIAVESFHTRKDSCEEILGFTKCKKIIKLADTDIMNYKAIKNRRPLVLDHEDLLSDFEQLIEIE